MAQVLADWNFEKAHAELKIQGEVITTKQHRPLDPQKGSKSAVEAFFGEEFGWVKVRAIWHGVFARTVTLPRPAVFRTIQGNTTSKAMNLAKLPLSTVYNLAIHGSSMCKTECHSSMTWASLTPATKYCH